MKLLSRLRVLIVTSWYPNKTNPIYGTFVREQAQALAKNHDVEVALFYPSDPEVQTKARQENSSAASGSLTVSGEVVSRLEEGVKTYRANLRFSGNPLKYLKGGFLAGRELKKIIRLFKPDIIHVHVSFPAGILTDFATLGMSIPYVITEHMSYLQEYTDKPPYRILLKHAFERAAKVLVVSPFLATQFQSLNWKVSPEYFPNVVDTSRFQLSINEPKNKKADAVNILFIGGMDQREVKGLQYLLPAFAEVYKEFAEVHLESRDNKKPHLHLVGDGEKRSAYEQLVQDLGMSDHCTFYGALPPEDMPQMYNQCDFLVLSSLKETFGVVLIEACACGKPVVSTACGGPETIVTDEVGILVEKENIQALAEGLRQMTNSYKDYSPEAIRTYAVNNYSSQVISQKLISLYQKVISS